MLSTEDHYIPPDRDAFRAADPATGRILIIAPTRAACETIEIGLTLDIQTYLEQNYGERVRELARSGAGFGIVAGTGTGKTLAVRPIAQEILKAPLNIGVVNREREATPELPNYNVIVITTGIARRWFQDGDITPKDTLVIDEIHQTSAELELCLALGKRVGCRFIWLSATVDPNFYREYLGSADVLEVYSFDPNKAALVRVVDADPLGFMDEKFAGQVAREERGVGAFLPTRAGVEAVARELQWRAPEINAAYYHGGEPVRVIRPFLEDEGAPRPFLLAMTAAGQSALNVRGLDTVVIEDARFSNVITRGRNVLTRQHLGSNEILQMAGRVHGRVEGGRVFILSNRAIDFARLKPTAPEFQLAGDSERVALTCADLGVRADELELPVPLDKLAYRNALEELQSRGIIGKNGRLSKYGKAVESLPVDRAWAELIVNAGEELLPYLAVISSIESLHRMTREERNLRGLIVEGSDHLTAYNLYAEAYQSAGYVGEVYGMPRHLFESEAIAKWADERGVLVKAIEDAALATACLFRGVNGKLPSEMPLANRQITNKFFDLLAKWMPFDLAIDETLADGSEARVGRSSMCGPDGAIIGDLRYFADRNGIPRASIEGTQMPVERLKKWAKPTEVEVTYNPNRPAEPLTATTTVEYFGFIFERRVEALKKWPKSLAKKARHALALAVAREQAHHNAVQTNRPKVEEIREIYARSVGQTASLSEAELTLLYQEQLDDQEIDSLLEFRNAKLELDIADYLSDAEREEFWKLPSEAAIGDFRVSIVYEIEDGNGVATLELPEKLARDLDEDDLPQLDRPLRFSVSRGSRGSVSADTLGELQQKLEGRWTPDFGSANANRRGRRQMAQGKTKPKAKSRGGLPRNKPRGGGTGGRGGRR